MTTKPDPVVEALERLRDDTIFDKQDAEYYKRIMLVHLSWVKEAIPLARSQAEKAALYDSTRAALEWVYLHLGHTIKLLVSHRPADAPKAIKQMIEKEDK